MTRSQSQWWRKLPVLLLFCFCLYFEVTVSIIICAHGRITIRSWAWNDASLETQGQSVKRGRVGTGEKIDEAWLFLRPFRPSLAPPSAAGYPRMEMMDIWWKNGNLRVKRSLRRTPTSWNINSCKEQDLQISFAVLLLWRNHESYPANHVRETRVYTHTTVKSIVKNVPLWMYIKLSG